MGCEPQFAAPCPTVATFFQPLHARGGGKDASILISMDVGGDLYLGRRL